MTWVKICGITNIADAMTAVDAGADAIGFVFYEKSPRYVDAAAAAEIVAGLPVSVEKVGVFVDVSQDRVAEVVNQVGLTAVQCSLGSTPKPSAENRASFPHPVRTLLPLSVTRLLGDERRLQGLMAEFLRMAESPKRRNSLDAFLLDSTAPDLPGGTGRAFDWQRIAPLVHVMNRSVKVVAAGGLNAGNVGAAMRILKPWGVDVSTGVEAEPGRKDHGKVRAFVRAVREAEKN
jgi:phosphoribosylanthranilate isomerase